VSDKVNILYVSDLDGTLLRDDAALSPFSKQLLQAMLRDGLPFTVASARSVASIRAIMAGLELRLPIIDFNGAFISELTTEQHLLVNDLPPAVVEDVYMTAGTLGHALFISTFDGAQDRLYYYDLFNEGMQWYIEDCRARGDKRLQKIDDPMRAFRERVVCLTVIDRHARLVDAEEAILARHNGSVETHLFENRYSPGWHWLTVQDRRATKDQAIRTIIEEWNLDDAELVVFGDDINDLKMFHLADRAIAVANAVEAVRAVATKVIGDNGEDSVVRFIRDEWDTHTQHRGGNRERGNQAHPRFERSDCRGHGRRQRHR
jgi:Cof subfamily protein (haloacid dehalogenase superfamily)